MDRKEKGAEEGGREEENILNASRLKYIPLSSVSLYKFSLHLECIF